MRGGCGSIFNATRVWGLEMLGAHCGRFARIQKMRLTPFPGSPFALRERRQGYGRAHLAKTSALFPHWSWRAGPRRS